MPSAAGWLTPAEALFVQREPTAAESEAVETVLDLAVGFDDSTLPLSEVRRLTTATERRTTIRFVTMTDPRRSALTRLFDALVDTETHPDDGRQYRTKHGVFSEAALRSAAARYALVEGRVRLLLAIRFPWLERPERDDKGRITKDGIRGDPIYAEGYDERMAIANGTERAPVSAGPKRAVERWRA